MGCTVLLPRLVGPARAAELILTGRLIRGDAAERIGLVNQAVPRSELPALVDATVEEIASAAPIAVAQAKATLSASLLRQVDDALHREANAQAIDFATGDLRRAIAAFRTGTTPEFTGE
jgi:enoyl-CoA hydratase